MTASQRTAELTMASLPPPDKLRNASDSEYKGSKVGMDDTEDPDNDGLGGGVRAANAAISALGIKGSGDAKAFHDAICEIIDSHGSK